MNSEDAIRWFTKDHPNPPKREDGSIDFEALCGEFLIEGVSLKALNKHYANLADILKREIK